MVAEQNRARRRKVKVFIEPSLTTTATGPEGSRKKVRRCPFQNRRRIQCDETDAA
jgi:hypothetical protein